MRVAKKAFRMQQLEQERALVRKLVATIVNLEKQCKTAGYGDELMAARNFALRYAKAKR